MPGIQQPREPSSGLAAHWCDERSDCPQDFSQNARLCGIQCVRMRCLNSWLTCQLSRCTVRSRFPFMLSTLSDCRQYKYTSWCHDDSAPIASLQMYIDIAFCQDLQAMGFGEAIHTPLRIYRGVGGLDCFVQGRGMACQWRHPHSNVTMQGVIARVLASRAQSRVWVFWFILSTHCCS